MMDALLRVENLTKIFGGLVSVKNLSFEIPKGRIVGLIGPNGAGKTTVLNVISGFLSPTGGSIFFNGSNITAKSPHQIARQGLVRTFQATTIYGRSTVMENILRGSHNRIDPGFFSSFLNTKKFRELKERNYKEAIDTLKMFDLEKYKDECAGNLAYGHQKCLGIIIALMSNPQCLLLDEPVAGMNPEETTWLSRKIEDLRQSGITILLVEHDMKMVMGICEKIIVISYGEKIAEGFPKEIQRDENVIRAYLGGDYHENN